MKKLLIFTLLFTAQAVTLAVAEQAADLSVTNAYIRTMPPGQTKTAGFLSVTNNGALSCQLTSAKSSLSSRIEFHEHQHSQGMMRMRPVAAVVVPPGETVVFAPGGATYYAVQYRCRSGSWRYYADAVSHGSVRVN